MLRHFYLIDNLADNFLTCHIAGLCLIAQTDTMAQHIMCYGTYIFWYDITTMFDKGVSTGCLSKTDTCTRTTTEGYHILQFTQAITFRITTGKDDICNILFYLLVQIHLIDNLTSL